MHLAFRVQSEEFLVVTRIKLRDVLHSFLFRIPNFGGARDPSLFSPFFLSSLLSSFFSFPSSSRDKARIETPSPVVGMKNGGSKKERDFFSRNIVHYKGEDTLVPYSQKDFHCSRRRRRWDFLIARVIPCIFKATRVQTFRSLMMCLRRFDCDDVLWRVTDKTV